MFSSVSALIGRIENEMTGLGSLPLRDFGCRNVFGLEDSVPKAPWMNRKVSIVIALLVATTVAGALTAPAEAALVKIIHLDCAQWHARLALLAKRKAHPRPPGAHHFAGRRHRVRIHFVCDCKDGAADNSAVDDLPGDGGPAGGARDPSTFSVLGSSSGSSAAFGWPAFSSGAALGAGAGGSEPDLGPGASPSPIASNGSDPLPPGDGTPFDPADPPSPTPTPLGPFPPLDPTTPPIASNVPEPSTWLLFGLGAAIVLAMKRRSDEPGRLARSCSWRLWRKPA